MSGRNITWHLLGTLLRAAVDVVSNSLVEDSLAALASGSKGKVMVYQRQVFPKLSKVLRMMSRTARQTPIPEVARVRRYTWTVLQRNPGASAIDVSCVSVMMQR